jgi:hypothetical protein
MIDGVASITLYEWRKVPGGSRKSPHFPTKAHPARHIADVCRRWAAYTSRTPDPMTMNDEADQRVQKKRTRNISELTQEQIQQKRSIDRKAQRAFRQRTKDRITHLEQDLAELEEASRRREKQLQDELKILRENNQLLLRRLEGIAYISTFPAHIDIADITRSYGSRGASLLFHPSRLSLTVSRRSY